MLYRRHLHRVYSYVLSRVANVQDAEDLTAQTFTAALQGIGVYEDRGTFIAWLLSIARRKAADHFRNQTSVVVMDDMPQLEGGAPAVDETVMEHLRIEEVALLLRKLNPERAEALRLRYLADLKIREVSDVMEKSEGAVKMLISRGLDDIRQVLNIQEEIS